MIKQNDEIDKKVDKIIKQMIKKFYDLDISYSELGRRAGINYNTIYPIFNGFKRTRLITIVALMDALGLELVVKEKLK